jgi:hypothetical protein
MKIDRTIEKEGEKEEKEGGSRTKDCYGSMLINSFST